MAYLIKVKTIEPNKSRAQEAHEYKKAVCAIKLSQRFGTKSKGIVNRAYKSISNK